MSQSQFNSMKRQKEQEICNVESTTKAKKTEYGSIVASHYNEIKETGLKERDKSRIVYLRNFNNWIKSFIISKYIDQIRDKTADDHKIIAIDLGCGKGGDLMKWQKGGISHLICADIAASSIEICQERYTSMKQRGRIFSAQFITCDCSKTRLKKLLSPPDRKVDLVSCQFVIHYSFESLSQAETMVRNAAESLRKGGFFMATFPNAYKIQSLLGDEGDKTISNEVFRIEFPQDRPQNPPLFGDMFNFFLEGVVNCPEFLLHYSTLERICKKYGLEPVYRKPFDKIYEEAIEDRDSKALFFKMKALEIYRSEGQDRLSSSTKSEYSHAEEYLTKNDVKSVKTLSKSEWETICLYEAVAFKKVT